MNVAEYLVERLRQLGCEHVFTVPGDYCGPFLEVLDASEGITRVATVSELGSGYAADGYARFRGVGAACVQYGVGTFSLLNCTAGSYVERLRVVVISASPGTKDRELERTRGVLFHHSTGDLEADRKVFENVTAASVVVDDPMRAPAVIDGALRAMLTRHRPAYVEVLADVWTQECAAPVGRLRPVPVTSDPAALAALLDAAWGRIRSARLPVLWAGVEVQRLGLQGLLQELVDLSGLPLTTTSLGKTVLDESQHQFVGTYAGPASADLTRYVMERCDCPVALGTIITDDYLDIIDARYGQMVEVTLDVARVGEQHYRDVTLEDVLAGLVERFRASGPRPWPVPELPPAEHGAPPLPRPGDHLTYEVFYRELTGHLEHTGLRDDVVLVLGESTSLYVFGNLFGLGPDGFVAQAAWGSLGHETGSALGVALGSGRRPVVVAGDGGFRMVCQELSSLAEQRCGAVVLVLSNDVYAIEQAFVDITAFDPDGEFAPFDVLPRWDYGALASAFGARGYRATTVEELRGVLGEALQDTGVPALVEVVVPPKDLPPQLRRLATPAPRLRRQGRDASGAP